tara:strand:+ start:216 stop:722 length:507 start_codon:yes stop_codon:yes gene_type:complete
MGDTTIRDALFGILDLLVSLILDLVYLILDLVYLLLDFKLYIIDAFQKLFRGNITDLSTIQAVLLFIFFVIVYVLIIEWLNVLEKTKVGKSLFIFTNKFFYTISKYPDYFMFPISWLSKRINKYKGLWFYYLLVFLKLILGFFFYILMIFLPILAALTLLEGVGTLNF